MECRLAQEPSETAPAVWKDGNLWYAISPVTKQPDATLSNPDPLALVREGGTKSAVWATGNNAVCKLRYWTHDMPLESKAIKFVRQNAAQVPIPEVI